MNPLAPLPPDFSSGFASSSLAVVQHMLDASLNGMIALGAIRVGGEAGTISDLRLMMINRVAANDIQRPLSQLVGQSIKTALPRLSASPLYDRLVRVLATGEPERFTFPYTTERSESRQFDMSLTRITDLVVVSYNDITDRYLSEQINQEQALQLRFVTDNALTAVALYAIVRDPKSNAVVDFRYELVNRMAERMVGRVSAELIGNTMRQAFPGIDQTPIWPAYIHLAETGETLQIQNHYTQHNLDIWYQVQGVREHDRIVLSFLDITELKRAQQRIERQNDEFRQVLDNALTAISHFTAVREEQADGQSGPIIDFVYQSFNRASEQVTGKKAQNVIGRRMLEIFPERRANGLFDRWVNLVNSRGSTRFQYQHEATGLWLDMQAIVLNDGFIQSYVDITPIKQAELEQQRQSDLINSLLSSLPVMFLLFRPVYNGSRQTVDFEVQEANQIAADSLGYRIDELIGKRLTDISPTIKNGPVYAEYVKVVETGTSTQFERQHGDQWFQISVVKFDDGFITSFVDITESRLYRQQLEAMNQELLRSNDSLEQFAYVASHDLQEPLRKIQSFGDLLDEHYADKLDDFGHDAIGRMQSAATRMSMLITDLLAYSRISTNRQPFQPVDLDQVLTGVLGDLEVRISETQAIIDRTPLPVIAGDPTQLRQLFQNLLSNALKFQPPASEERTQPPHIQIDCQQELIDGRMWYDIAITDNGIGFDPKYVDRIFQVFQRLHSKQAYAGTGVGLAICKRVIDSHGGTLTARSQPGQGATFQIHLPG
ncbi:PAS domain-containing protein [uncultured Fibrella sp.]|uniref:PAS domain-containing sensor histidine kinase n=1 Tax=uncultured Fibrella sp. TaxID=1284596 RepID=UPI0035CC8499